MFLKLDITGIECRVNENTRIIAKFAGGYVDIDEKGVLEIQVVINYNKRIKNDEYFVEMFNFMKDDLMGDAWIDKELMEQDIKVVGNLILIRYQDGREMRVHTGNRNYSKFNDHGEWSWEFKNF